MALPPGFELEQAQAPQGVKLPPGFQLEAAQAESPYSAKNIAGAAVEPNLSLLSGAVAAPLSGLAGIAGTVMPGPEGQGAEWTRKVGDALSYQPRTQGGQTATEAVGYPFRKLGEGANWAGEKTAELTDSPAAGAAVNAGLQVGGPMLLARLLSGKNTLTPEQEAEIARGKQQAEVLRKGRDLGLTVPPTQVNSSWINRLLESIGGKAATQQEASASNQNIAYSAGQRTAGLSPNKSLTEEVLKTAREEVAAPYRDVAKIFDNAPKTPATEFLQQNAVEALDKWKTANAQANRWFAYAGQSKLPTAFDKAQRFRDAAVKSLDDLDSIAQSTPNGAALVPELKAARVQLAKIHTVEDAMRGSNFNAQALAKALEKDLPLSGDLKTIGQFAQDFPKSMAPPQTGGSAGVNQLLPYLGVGGGGAAGALLGGGAGAGAGSLIGLAASQALPPAARSLILSPMYQRLMANPKAAPGVVSELLRNRTALTGAMQNQEKQ
mgnify:CR=1 FL=1